MRDGADSTGAVVRLLIAVLCGAALLLIVLILSGSEIDDTSGKAIGTAVALAFFSLTGVAGSNLANRRPEFALFGYATATMSLIAFLAVLGAIWSSDLFDDDWRVAGDTIVLAIAAGHASLLLASVHDGDSEAVRLTRAGTLLAIGVLCLMAVVEISSQGEDVGPKAIGVVAVLYVLGTALLPLLRRSTADARKQVAASPVSAETGVLRLDHLVIAVTDWERSNAFYRDVLGAQPIALPEGRVAYRIGNQQLNVHGPGVEAAPLPLKPVQPGNSDLCFAWSAPIATAVEHLYRHGVPIVAGPVTRIGAYGPGQSVYFNDPDGSLIELIAYSG
jgi:catechol 2,3-dioxygenase-like lactoylglutathione lyase family enzyme